MSYITPRIIKFGKPENHRSSIGHAMYNYITALLLAKKYNLTFLHSPFIADCERFENVLGLNKFFPNFKTIRMPEYKLLPYCNFGHPNLDENKYNNSLRRLSIEINKKTTKTIFFTNNPAEQFPGLLIRESEYLSNILSEAYWSVNGKSKLYDYSKTNVAIHIRRG